MGKLSRLTECELLTMKCIWDARKPITCGEIIQQIRDKYGIAYKDTTVYTYLNKLRDKKFLNSFPCGATHYYPVVDEETYRNEHLNFMRSFWFEGSAEQFLSAVMDLDETERDMRERKRMRRR